MLALQVHDQVIIQDLTSEYRSAPTEWLDTAFHIAFGSETLTPAACNTPFSGCLPCTDFRQDVTASGDLSLTLMLPSRPHVEQASTAEVSHDSTVVAADVF